MVFFGTAKSGEKELKTNWPIGSTEYDYPEEVGIIYYTPGGTANENVSISSPATNDNVTVPVTEGFKLTPSENITLKSVTVSLAAPTDPTNVILKSSAGAVIQTSSVVAGVATFDNALTSGTSYRIEAQYLGSGTQTVRTNSSFTYPTTKTRFVINNRSSNGSDVGNSYLYAIESVSIDYASLVETQNTIPAGTTKQAPSDWYLKPITDLAPQESEGVYF